MLTCSRRRIVSCACTGVHGSCYLEWLEQPAHLVESQVHVPHASDHAVARTQKKQIGYHARRMRASATAPLHLHFVRPASAPTRAAPVTVGGAANTAGKDVRMGMSASALTRRGLRQPSHVLYAWSASRTGTPYSRQLRCWRPELLSARTPLARCNHVHVQYCILGGCKCKCKYFTSHIHIGL